MDFRFDEDQLAMRDAVRSLCADHFDLTRVAERDGAPLDEATWAALVELGIIGMLAPDSGFGLVEATVVLEELGAHLASGPVLWSVLAAPFVAGVAEGEVRVTGIDVGSAVEGPVVVENGPEADLLLVLRDDRAELVRLADVAGAVPGASIDPLTPTTILPALPAGEVVLEGAAVEQLRRDGRILTAAFLVGAAQAALDVAKEYALGREQFGVPIGSFQAVKHLLADMYVRVEMARASTYAAAALAAGLGEGDADLASCSAKHLAGEAGHVNGRVAVQVLGGMGFTWDMLPHYFLKRAIVLDQSFGTSSSQAARIGAAVGAEVASA
jgi:alkylation response protein AidB-like acyl-CoA dehydrogenase